MPACGGALAVAGIPALDGGGGAALDGFAPDGGDAAPMEGVTL